MKKSPGSKVVVLYWMFFLCIFMIPRANAQSGEKVVNILTDLGFENVGWTENVNERVYVLQNSAYRLNGVGIGKAVDVIQKNGLPDNKPCRIVVLDNNIPQISLYYHAVHNDNDSVELISRKDWTVGYELGDSWKQVKKVENSSLFKVDVLVYPQLAFKNLVITQIYQVLFDLSPAVEVSIWKGMKLTGQLKIPIYNDGYGRFEDKVHPGHLTISQSWRLPYNIFGRVTLGCFNADRYGIDIDVFRPFKDERFSLMGRVGYTGVGYWDSFKFHYDPEKIFTWSVGGSFYWPQFNTQFNLKFEQYLREEKGVKVEMIRHFRYCSIGFYAMKAESAKMNGGFRFQILLPPYGKYKRYKYYPRVNTSPNMGIVYNAGNEQFYYKDYKAEASDNIMQQNNFNPYFIKSELLNF